MDKYVKVKKIGKGHFGDVYLVKRKSDLREFAMKRVGHLDFDTENTVAQVEFPTEVKLLEKLSHPNIVKYHETFIHKDRFCIILDYADGGDLDKFVNDRKKSKEIIPEGQILLWFTQLCLATKYLTDNKILHRDIKLQNIFSTKNGLIKLGDFGISKKLENTNQYANTSVGTPYYVSPEICQNKNYDHKSDIWMMGCVLYEMCTLEKPFSGENFAAIIWNIVHNPPKSFSNNFSYSTFLQILILSMIEKDPEKRPHVTDILQLPQIVEKIDELCAKFPLEYESMINQKQKTHQRNNSKKMIEIEDPVPVMSNIGSKKKSPNSLSSLINKAKNIQSPINTTSTTYSEKNSFDTMNSEERFHPADKNIIQNRKPYLKDISINTSLDPFVQKQPSSNEKQSGEFSQLYSQKTTPMNDKKSPVYVSPSSLSDNGGAYDKKGMFQFAKNVFDTNSPMSQYKLAVRADFLKKQLGNEKFDILQKRVESQPDLGEIIKDKKFIDEIFSKNQMFLLNFLECLLPEGRPAEKHFRTKSINELKPRVQNEFEENKVVEKPAPKQIVSEPKISPKVKHNSFGKNTFRSVDFKGFKAKGANRCDLKLNKI